MTDTRTSATPLRLFPVLVGKYKLDGGVFVPWSLLEPHERQAMANHGGQTLRRLAERGGLSACELAAVLEDRKWTEISEAEAWSAIFKAASAVSETSAPVDQDEIIEVLRELVTLKDMKDRFGIAPFGKHNNDAAQADYKRRKPLAWAAARRALKNPAPQVPAKPELIGDSGLMPDSSGPAAAGPAPVSATDGSRLREKEPLPPEVLAGALQDKVETAAERTRPAVAARSAIAATMTIKEAAARVRAFAGHRDLDAINTAENAVWREAMRVCADAAESAQSASGRIIGWLVAVEEDGVMKTYGGLPYRSKESAEEDANLPRARGQKADVWEVRATDSGAKHG